MTTTVRQSRWTPDEDTILERLYQHTPPTEHDLRTHLPARTVTACRQRATKRHLTDPAPDQWSRDEDLTLERLYEHGTPTTAELRTHLPARTVRAARMRASDLKITDPAQPAWTDREEQALRDLYRPGPPDDDTLTEHLPTRTVAAARSRASTLNITRAYNAPARQPATGAA